MKLILHCFFLFLLFIQAVYSQSVERFHFDLPEKQISNCKYNSFEFIDSRSGTLNFGKVYSDHYKRKVPLVASIDMGTQLNWLIHLAQDSGSGMGELLFQLRKLEFVELGGEIPNYGYCPIRVEIYVKNKQDYIFLNRLDTFLIAEKTMGGPEVTESLLNQAKSSLSAFVLRNLDEEIKENKIISLQQIIKIDSIEKSVLPLYLTQKYTSGVYLSYDSFKSQTPDYKLLNISRKNNEIHSLTIEDKKGKALKINYKEVYSFVYADTAYLSDRFGCYALQKKDNDFYFIGKGKAMAKEESLALARALGGIPGEQMAKNNAFALFHAKIDHCDGSVIWYDKIK